MKKHLLLFSLLIFAAISLLAQPGTFDVNHPTKPYFNTVTTAAPFLLIAPDSRAGGMGEVGVGTSADNYSQHHNPAKYVFNNDIFGIGIAYSPWLKMLVNDINLAYLASFWKITENDAIAASLKYFSLGDILFTDENGDRLYMANPNEFSLDFTYSRKLSKIVSMAITPRFIYSNLGTGAQSRDMGLEMKTGLAGAVDISVFVDKEWLHNKDGFKSSELMFGANISNIGNKISYSTEGKKDFLPCNLRLGFSYAMAFDDYNKLALNIEAGKLLVPTPSIEIRDSTEYRYIGNKGQNHNELNSIEGIGYAFFGAPGGVNEKFREVVWSVGAEYSYRNILFVRVGGFMESKWKGNRKFATVGVGVKYSIFALDVSYLFSPRYHPLENSLRFSLTFLLKSFNKEQIKNQGLINRN